MPRPRASSPRFDFRGGVNRTHTEDVLSRSELRLVQNFRARHGSLRTRGGSRRLHSVALAAGAPVLGVFQWDSPGGKQIVAIAGGNLYHKLEGQPEFAAVPANFSLTRRPSFATHRTGANIVLYIADGTLRRWDGNNLTVIAGAPPLAEIAIYKNRMVGADGTKAFYWSRTNDPTRWAVADDGGSADVEVYDTEGVQGVLVVGSSALIAKEDNIARFTGADPERMELVKDTEGVSNKVGLIASRTFIGTGEAGFLLSAKGAFVVTEAGVQDIGLKIQADLELVNRAAWQHAVAAYHGHEKEILLAVPGAGHEENDAGYAFSLEEGSWSGPWSWPFGICSLAEYERPDGTEGLIAGGYDGYVRELEPVGVGTLDDVLADGTGGTPVAARAGLPLLYGDPRRIKSMRIDQTLEADLGTAYDPGPPEAGNRVRIAWGSDLGNGGVWVPSKGPGVRSYRFRLGARGRRLNIALEVDLAEAIELVGLAPAATIEGF